MTGLIASEIAADDQVRALTGWTGRASRQPFKINYCSLTPRDPAELLKLQISGPDPLQAPLQGDAQKQPQVGLEIPALGSALFPELPRPSSHFLIVFDFRRLDGGEQVIEFGLGRVANGANGHDRFAGGEHDLGRSVDREAQHHGGERGVVRQAFNP